VQGGWFYCLGLRSRVDGRGCRAYGVRYLQSVREGLGFRAQGSELRAKDSGLRAQGSRLKAPVYYSRLRVQSSGLTIWTLARRLVGIRVGPTDPRGNVQVPACATHTHWTHGNPSHAAARDDRQRHAVRVRIGGVAARRGGTETPTPRAAGAGADADTKPTSLALYPPLW
jgi:hypothetical protein